VENRTGAVAVMGLAVTRSQILKISKYPVRVIVLDSDFNAQKVAKKLCDSLKSFSGKTYNVQLDAKDPEVLVRERFLN